MSLAIKATYLKAYPNCPNAPITFLIYGCNEAGISFSKTPPIPVFLAT